MKALIIKDFMVLNRAIKLCIIFIPCSIMISVGLSFLFSLLIGMACISSAIGYDEQSKWDKMSVMMPYSRFDLVVEKYMIGYIWIVVALLLGTIGNFVAETIFYKEPNIYNTPDMVIIQLSVVLIIISAATWALLKFGSQKSKIINMSVMFIVYGIGITFSSNPENLVKLSNMKDVIPTILFILAIICNIISIMCSLKIKSK